MTCNIGLVGLGLVGTAIAESLLDLHFDVVGFDISPERCHQLDKSGGKSMGSAADVAGRVERVILSLPDTTVVRQVVEGPNGILEAESLPAHIIDTTTGDPAETISLAERLAERSITFLDSTISGSSKQVAEKVFYAGPSGSGSKAKLASNLILGLNRLALAEGLVFAEKLGLDPAAFLELLKVTPAYSAIMDTKGQKMLDGDFTPQARVRQHHKDVALILKYAENAGQELPLSKVHLDVLERSIAAGDADLDNSAIIKEIRRRTRL